MDQAVVPASSVVTFVRAISLGEALAAALRRSPAIDGAELAGGARRRAEPAGELVVIVAARAIAPVWSVLARVAEVDTVRAAGPIALAADMWSGPTIEVRVVTPEMHGAALLFATGSPRHVAALVARAANRGLHLDSHGLWNRGERVAGATERDIYARLGLAYIAPELREASGEIEAAASGRLPRLLEEADVVGDLHVGAYAGAVAVDLDDLAATAAIQGRSYLAVVERVRFDGLDLNALADHVTAVRAASSRRMRLAAGIELAVGSEGCPEIAPSTLAMLDWVVAAAADRARPGEPGDETDGLIAALDTCMIDAVRIGPTADLSEVLSAARARGAALELSVRPGELEHAVRLARAAQAARVPIALTSRADGPDALDHLRLAVWAARRAWIEPGDVISTRSWDELQQWRSRRSVSGPRRVRPERWVPAVVGAVER